MLDGADYTVATGYGRHRVKADEVIPEIRAHYLGAVETTGLENFTLLDIGGQDFKIIPVRGRVMEDFIMNDKCAAGTGRFLEKMASQLDMTLDQLGQYWEDPAEISAVCAVFAETEVISHMIEGIPVERIAAGVNWSLYHRLRPLLLRARERTIVLSGGGTSGIALSRILEMEGFEPIRLEHAIYNGSIGCLTLALKKKHVYRDGMLRELLPQASTT